MLGDYEDMYINFENYNDNWGRANAVIDKYCDYCKDNTYRAITEEDVLEILSILKIYFEGRLK